MVRDVLHNQELSALVCSFADVYLANAKEYV